MNGIFYLLSWFTCLGPGISLFYFEVTLHRTFPYTLTWVKQTWSTQKSPKSKFCMPERCELLTEEGKLRWIYFATLLSQTHWMHNLNVSGQKTLLYPKLPCDTKTWTLRKQQKVRISKSLPCSLFPPLSRSSSFCLFSSVIYLKAWSRIIFLLCQRELTI